MPTGSSYVVTFYSYKGGVGRTTLLVNVAFELANRGHRIVLWDLDLEAPGLHEFPQLRPPEIWERGFLEWMREPDWTSGPPDSGQFDQLMSYCYEPVSETRPGGGAMIVLPAHGSNTNPATLYAKVPWHQLLVESPARAAWLFQKVVESLDRQFEPAFILIDSRTGLTDLGGLLTATVPDCTVLVGSHGRQSMVGMRRVYQSLLTFAGPEYASAGRTRPLDLVLVASPVRFGDAARGTHTEESLPFHFSVPFDADLVHGEAVQITKSPTGPTAIKYRNVVDELLRLRDRARPEPALRYFETKLQLRSIDQAALEQRGMIERCRRLFGFIGFEVRPADDQSPGDFVARRVSTFHTEEFVVRCVVGELRGAAFEELARAPSMLPRVVIADEISGAVRPAAQSRMNVRTLRELEAELIDLRAYAAMVRAAYEASPLARTYIRQRFLLTPSFHTGPLMMRGLDTAGLFNEGGEAIGDAADPTELPDEGNDALAEAHAWATDDEDRLWLVLGDFGTGKTCFFQRFAYELALRALEEPAAPVPIAIDLRRVSGAPSLEVVLQQHLGTALRWHRDPTAILDLLSAGRIVLLLDGFDEMGAAAYGATIGEQLKRMIQPSLSEGTHRRGNRILITCRTHFFRDDEQPWRATGSSRQSRPRRGELGKLSELALFNEAQIQAFLTARLGPDAARRTSALLASTYGLRELAPRPMLLEMIAHTIGERLAAADKISVGLLYEEYVRDWLKRASQSAQTTPAMRERLLERLAAELWTTPDNELHYSELADLIQSYGDDFQGLDATRVDLELRSAAFLVRESTGEYRFSHRSFLEFFMARYLLHTLQGGVSAFRMALETADLTEPCASFLSDVASSDGRDALELAAALTEILVTSYAAKASENALRLAVWLRVSGQPAFSALPPGKARLEGAMLQGDALPDAQLASANLTGANLLRARLAGAHLAGASLRGAVLEHCDLSDAVFDGADLQDASLRHARLANTSLVKANLRDADLRGSRAACAPDLRGATLDGVRWDGAAWREPRIDGPVTRRASDSLPHWRVDELKEPREAWLRSLIPARCEALAAAPGGTHVVLAEGGGTASLRALEDMVPEQIFELRATGCENEVKKITAVAMSQDRNEIALGCGGGDVVTRSLNDPEVDACVATGLSSIEEIRFADRGLIAVSARGGVVLIQGTDVVTLRMEENPVTDLNLGVSEDGDWLALGAAHEVQWIDLRSRDVRRLPVRSAPLAIAVRGASPALAVAVDDSLIVYDHEGQGRAVPGIGDDKLADLAWIGDGLVIVGETGVAFWRPGAAGLEELDDGGRAIGPASIRGADRDRVYLKRRRSLSVAAPGMPGRALLALSTPALAASFLDERHLLVCIADRVELWDLATLVRLAVDVSMGEVIFDAIVYVDPGGRRILATSDPAGGELHELGQDMLLQRIERPTPYEGVHQVAVSSDGRWRVAVGDGARLYDDTAASRQLQFWPDTGPASVSEDASLVFGAAFHPTEPWLATAHEDHVVRIWSMPTVERGVPQQLDKLSHPDSVHTVAFGPGDMLISGCRDGKLRRWVRMANAWHQIAATQLHDSEINGVAFSPMGDRIAVACDDRAVFVVDSATLEVMGRLHGHESNVHTARWSPRGDRLVTASWDGTVRLWDANTGCELAALDGRMGEGVWTAAGYASELDDDAYLTDGRICVPAALYEDLVVNKQLVIAAVAGKPIERLKIDVRGAARRFTAVPVEPSMKPAAADSK